MTMLCKHCFCRFLLDQCSLLLLLDHGDGQQQLLSMQEALHMMVGDAGWKHLAFVYQLQGLALYVTFAVVVYRLGPGFRLWVV